MGQDGIDTGLGGIDKSLGGIDMGLCGFDIALGRITSLGLLKPDRTAFLYYSFE